MTEVRTGPLPAEIKAQRTADGLTQEAAGKLVGYTTRGWQDAEIGQREMPWRVWMLYRARVAALTLKAPCSTVVEILREGGWGDA